MDAAAFEQVNETCGEFHSFPPASGHKQRRDNRQNYLWTLLVKSQDWRNAENRSESVEVSARAMPRFPTEARRSDDTVQLYVGESFPAPGLRPAVKRPVVRTPILSSVPPAVARTSAPVGGGSNP